MAELVYGGVITGFKGAFSALGLKFDLVGLENIPETGGAVFAINHTSYLDFALAGWGPYVANKRLVRFMAKDAVWGHWLGGPLMRGMKHIPVNREAGARSLVEAIKVAKSGELVGVFPEATMSRSMEVKEIKSGAVRIAQASGTPLIPTIVFGGQRLLGYGVRDFKTRGRTICLTYGEPMHLERSDDAEAATQELRRRMQVLLDQTLDRYPAPDPGEEAWWLPKRRGGTAPTIEEAEEIDARVRRERAERKAAKAAAKQAK